MKKSLVISEKQKYGPSSFDKPSPAMPGGKKSPPRKFAPTITLTGQQVDAFCGCELKAGDTGTATVHYVVKAVGDSGEHYGDELAKPAAKPQKITLQLTHVESEEKGDDEEGEDAEEEKGESGDDEIKEEDSEEETDDEDAPKAPAKETVSPSDAGLG